MPRPPHYTKTAAQEPPQLKRIALSFVIAVVAIVGMVLYYSLARATVTLEVGTSREVRETSLEISETSQGSAVRGTVMQTEVEQSKSFTASTAGEKEDKASGAVTITNTTGASQTLIATTRLLNPQSALFRLKETITVPARGKLADVPVIADKPGEASEIAATKFTFPGLRANLQDKIYAESTEPMRRAAKPSNKVTNLDLEQARKTLGETLVPQALAKLREQLPQDKKSWSIVYQADTTQGDSSVPAGTAKPNFTYHLKAKVTAVFYDPDSLRTQVLAKLRDNASMGHKIVSVEDKSLAVSLDSASSESQTAVIKVKLLAEETVTDPDIAFSKRDLLGRTPVEVKNYFSNIPGVKSAEIELSPFWVKTVPTVESHITIQLKP